MVSNFKALKIDKTYSFSEFSQKDTTYITHSYYTYPAKFIPQLASKLIRLYSKENDTILDPFMGSGTTLVESLINKRKCAGVDINEIAYLVTKVKTTPLESVLLQKELSILEDYFSQEPTLFTPIWRHRYIFKTKSCFLNYLRRI